MDKKINDSEIKDFRIIIQYLDLAEFYANRGMYDRALEIISAAMEEMNYGIFLVFEFLLRYEYFAKDYELMEKFYRVALKKGRDLDEISMIMHNYYKETNQVSRYINNFLNLFKYHDANNLKVIYRQALDFLKEKELKNLEPEMLKFAKERDLYTYIMILLRGSSNETKRSAIFKALRTNLDFDHFLLNEHYELARPIMDIDYMSVADRFWLEADYYVSKKTKKDYQNAVRVLEFIKEDLYGDELRPEWREEFKEFKAKHKRKSSLMAEIKTKRL
ncbi:hypothetical protein [Fundicoccus culcitae]|uniref:Tetratricopeptide repeat protein n=1 Tax=Fundicoccus culcitae TaxID=2969821 RepID=A0ABY5P7T5_9LACT|nr:hypothetical protein [Fundicoccus culcitae]UUX34714.1 hypothetical protein NRE15_03420 [Fundicoccus culcitae]